ncbi:glycosyltransferase family 4 protein [Campylobacter geochelonis]|uniref:Cell division protease FtsH-like protein n=1 Tax=Campylobacter geochelonis TaxID=1780362 RepID=A0A128EKL4_9BACT|nr:glycosyltransferase family 4 protein [Campylobacter geochelonis]QKF71222.1 glycosyltransferase, family 4 [Campylobacter geochelonis]CZE49137.1 cell division protease FtsH-like protein [Campylobacter geochelonis]
MKKIVFIHILNDRSGSPKILSQIIDVCNKNGYLTELFTNTQEGGFLDNKAKVYKHIFYKRSNFRILTLFYYILSQIILFFKCLKYKNQDVVFYINTMLPFGAALSGRLINKEIIYHIHETSLKPKLLKLFLRFIIKKTANKIIFVTEYLKNIENFQNKNQKVIYNAIPKIKYTLNNKIKKNKFIILLICSLKTFKGIHEFIKISENMLDVKEIEFQLILNANEKEINDFFSKCILPNNITIFSRQDDLKEFYKSGSLLLNLSRPDECIETFGLTILEGMSYGLPAIVPNIGGPLEIIKDNVNGYAISCYEIAKISKKIRYLFENKEEYLKMSFNALSTVKDFSIEIFDKEILNILMDGEI